MNSPRNTSTVYEPAAFGSRIIYGDSNETVRMVVMCLQKLADQFGQYDVVKAVFRPLERTRVWDCEFFDMSEGIPNALVALYRDWGVEQLQREYIPYVLRATEKDDLRYTVLAAVGLVGDCTNERLREKLAEVVGFRKFNTWLHTDWPGMDTCSYAEYIYHRLTGSPVITDCRGVKSPRCAV